MQLDGVAAIVTGGASGLGEATVRELAAAGAVVTIFDRDRARGEPLAAEVGGAYAAGRAELARDLARFGIRVCTMALRIFDTPLLRRSPEAFLTELEKTTEFPNGRFGDPAEYARLARQR